MADRDGRPEPIAALIPAVARQLARNHHRTNGDTTMTEQTEPAETSGSEPVNPVIATAESAAGLCKAAAFLIANPQGHPGTWLDHVPSEARQQLATWLRTEAHAFRQDATRGSAYGYPSWYFARAVGNAFADVDPDEPTTYQLRHHNPGPPTDGVSHCQTCKFAWPCPVGHAVEWNPRDDHWKPGVVFDVAPGFGTALLVRMADNGQIIRAEWEDVRLAGSDHTLAGASSTRQIRP